MAIVEENGIVDPSSNPGQGWVSLHPRERHESNSFHLSNEWIVGQTGFFSLSLAISLEEGKLWIQASCTLL